MLLTAGKCLTLIRSASDVSRAPVVICPLSLHAESDIATQAGQDITFGMPFRPYRMFQEGGTKARLRKGSAGLRDKPRKRSVSAKPSSFHVLDPHPDRDRCLTHIERMTAYVLLPLFCRHGRLSTRICMTSDQWIYRHVTPNSSITFLPLNGASIAQQVSQVCTLTWTSAMVTTFWDSSLSMATLHR